LDSIVSVKSSQDQLRKEFPAPNLEIVTDNQQVCENLQGKVDQNTIIISAMAGVPLNKIKKWLEHNLVIKIMPTIVLYNPTNCMCLNTIEVQTEKEVDMATAVSGFLAQIMEQ